MHCRDHTSSSVTTRHAPESGMLARSHPSQLFGLRIRQAYPSGHERLHGGIIANADQALDCVCRRLCQTLPFHHIVVVSCYCSRSLVQLRKASGNPPTTARNKPLTDSSPMHSIVLLLAIPRCRLVEDAEGSGQGGQQSTKIAIFDWIVLNNQSNPIGSYISNQSNP